MYQGEKMDISSAIGGLEQIVPEPVEVRLERKKKNLEAQLADVNKAIEVLKSDPKTLDLLNILRRVGI
jgi:hypothetical protein